MAKQKQRATRAVHVDGQTIRVARDSDLSPSIIKMMLEHQRELAKMQASKEYNDDQVKLKVEQLQQQLVEMELKYNAEIAPSDFTYNPLTGELTDRGEPEV